MGVGLIEKDHVMECMMHQCSQVASTSSSVMWRILTRHRCDKDRHLPCGSLKLEIAKQC